MCADKPQPTKNGSVADAPRRNWVDAWAPAPARPYLQLMRADRPIGTWLLLLPCWQSLALAIAADLDRWRSGDPWLFAAFAVGAFVMRGAGCCLNDIIDRDIDAKVARTRSRPLPSMRVGLIGAVAFMIILCLIGLGMLLTMNDGAITIGLISLAPAAIYPFMKRVTYWPQFFLGIAFNWGALMGWTAHYGGLYWPAVLLYLGGIAWTLGYDTIYAHQDREDDMLIGVKSSALRLGGATRPWLAGFYGAAMLLAGAAIAAAGVTHWAAWVGLALYGAHLGWQVLRLDIDNRDWCLTLFRANRNAGLVLLAGLLIAGIA